MAAGPPEVSDRAPASAADPRFAALVEGTREIIFEIREDGRVASAFGTAHTGWSTEQVLGLSAFDFAHPEDAAAMREALTAFVDRGDARPREVRGLHADGVYRWYELRAARYTTPDGEPRVLVMGQDIEERKQAELALRESEQRFRSLVDQSPFGVLIVDGQLNVVAANRAYAELVGAGSVETLGPHNLWKSPALAAVSTHELIERVASGERIVTEVSYTSLFGKQVDVRAHIAPLSDERGQVVGAQLLFEDVSASRALEDQLRQSQKMEAVGRLAGGIAHDFNNYLTVILGCGEAIREDSPPGSEIHEASDQIVEAAERSAALTRQLLAFSRRQVTRPEVVDLGDIVSRLEPILRRVLGDGIALRCEVRPGRPSIWADPSLLEQVLMNLTANARDAMAQGGCLEIVVSPAPSTEAEAGGSRPAVMLEVRDEGVGMEPATRARIFEPFFTTKPESLGTGLGLSTVYGIVRQLGGSIEVESEPGRGSRFRISIPECDEERVLAARTGRIPQPDLGGNERILLVEDEATIRGLAADVLRRGGYAVVEAVDGCDALDRLRKDRTRFDLVLTDVLMPRMNGVELARALRTEEPELPVLFMSGYAEAMLEQDGGLPRDVDLLQKPFSPRSLRARVRAVLDRKAEPAAGSPASEAASGSGADA